jgi:hypothetical protein
MVFQVSPLKKIIGLRRSSGLILTLGVVSSMIVKASPSFSQYPDRNLVETFDVVEATAADFHNDKFREAEQALTQGLSQSGLEQAPRRPQPDLKPVSANTTTTTKIQPAVREVKELPLQPVKELESDDQFIDALADRPSSQPKALPIPQQKKAPQIQEEIDTPQVIASPRKELAPSRPVSAPQQSNNTALKTKQAVAVLENKITEGENEARELKRQLSEAKSALAAAELEISRLSSIIQEASRARLNMGEAPRATRSAITKQAPETSRAIEVKPVKAAAESSLATGQDMGNDLQVATIAVDKADLRLGPGRNHSALMSLRRGSRLAVEARQGEWYRVFAPNGQRAWIHSSLVRFGDGAASLNDGSSVKVRGYDSKLRQ